MAGTVRACYMDMTEFRNHGPEVKQQTINKVKKSCMPWFQLVMRVTLLSGAFVALLYCFKMHTHVFSLHAYTNSTLAPA